MPNIIQHQRTKQNKIEKEKHTVTFMIAFYCKHKHKTAELCNNCTLLSQYALKRLDNCPYGELKTACRDCKTHCYKPEMRQKIREVMRYSGPRMIFYAPLLTLKHFIKRK